MMPRIATFLVVLFAITLVLANPVAKRDDITTILNNALTEIKNLLAVADLTVATVLTCVTLLLSLVGSLVSAVLSGVAPQLSVIGTLVSQIVAAVLQIVEGVENSLPMVEGVLNQLIQTVATLTGTTVDAVCGLLEDATPLSICN